MKEHRDEELWSTEWSPRSIGADICHEAHSSIASLSLVCSEALVFPSHWHLFNGHLFQKTVTNEQVSPVATREGFVEKMAEIVAPLENLVTIEITLASLCL